MAVSFPEYCRDLAKRHSDAVGFLPADRYRVAADVGNVIAQTENGEWCGFLIHGPVKPGGMVTVWQCCVATDARRRHSATLAVEQLVTRANGVGAVSLRLKCAADLEANLFWRSVSFLPIDVKPGGRRRERTVIVYERKLVAWRQRLIFDPTVPQDELDTIVINHAYGTGRKRSRSTASKPGGLIDGEQTGRLDR